MDSLGWRFSNENANVSAFLTELKTCSSPKDLERGKRIHADAIKCGDDSNKYIANTLIRMYSKCGSMLAAHQVFDSIRQPNVVAWNALLLGYAESGEGELALKLFSSMCTGNVEPDTRTFVAALKACSNVAIKEEGKHIDGKLVKVVSLQKGMDIHSQATANACDSSTFVANSLMGMYIKCGSLAEARRVFDRIKHRTVVSWNVLILGYAENGKEEIALDLFSRMQTEGIAIDARTFLGALQACSNMALKEEGRLVKVRSLRRGMDIETQATRRNYNSDIYVASGLVDMFAKCGSMDNASRVYAKMQHCDLVACTALMLGYVENGEGELALQIFRGIKTDGFVPDDRTFVAALKACGAIVALESGKKIHNDICRLGMETHLLVASSLVDFYGKCGDMLNARLVFESMLRKDLVTWNSLIAGYACQGDTECLFTLFDKLQDEGLHANRVTFLCILAACNHAGRVDKGKAYFEAMRFKFGINPGLEHYHCLIDVLGRTNKLDEAMAMVRSMPHSANAVTWTMLLDACRRWKNVDVGKLSFESLTKFEHDADSAFSLMSSTL